MSMEIAKTILSQLGGKLVCMTGARDLIGHPDGLSFKFPAPTPSKGNHCQITLLPSDTYRVTFRHLRSKHVKTVVTFEGVYCDQLMDIFEQQTGLYLTLSPRR